MARDSNQHYVTRSLLDKFVHPSSTDRVLFPYRKGYGACRRRGVGRLGSAMNFYRQIVAGEPTDELDEARSVSESRLFNGRRGSPLVSCIFDDRYVPGERDAYQLAAAAAFLWCGSPVQIHNAAMLLLLHEQVELLNRLDTEEGKRFYENQYGEDGHARLQADRERILKGQMKVDVGRENWKQLGFRSFDIEADILNILISMRLSVVTCHPNAFFVTGDNPVSNKSDLEVWFPISFNRGLLWHRRNREARCNFGHSETREYNRRMIRDSHKFVYSPQSAEWLHSASKEILTNPLFGHYGSLEELKKHAVPSFGADGKEAEKSIEVVEALLGSPVPDILGL